MTYGVEVVISLETVFLTLRMSSFTPSNNDKLLGKSLDLIEGRRESVMVQLAYYQHKLKQGYDANVKLRPLALGDLVLRKVLGTAKNLACVYHLEDLDENVVLRPWNVNNLKRYYY